MDHHSAAPVFDALSFLSLMCFCEPANNSKYSKYSSDNALVTIMNKIIKFFVFLSVRPILGPGRQTRPAGNFWVGWGRIRSLRGGGRAQALATLPRSVLGYNSSSLKKYATLTFKQFYSERGVFLESLKGRRTSSPLQH